MHKVFKILDYITLKEENCNECGLYYFILQHDSKKYSIECEMPYCNECFEIRQISFKDDSWLDKNLREIK